MAAGVTPLAPRRRVPWNPLACSDTAMRPGTLLMAKLAWLLLVVGGYWKSLHAPVTPAVGLLDAIPAANLWLALLFWSGGLCLLLNRFVIGASALVGGVVLLAPFESLIAWHPYAWVCGGVLVLCALQRGSEQPVFLRWFAILVHVAAFLGALHGAGWIGTALTSPGSETDFVGAVPRWIAALLPPGALANGLRWYTLVVCAVVPVALVIPRLRRLACWLALVFYTTLYLAIGTREVALFAGAMAVAQISFLDWPRFVIVLWPRACGWPLWLRIALDRYDLEHRTDWPRPPDPDAELEAWFDLRPLAGPKAIVNLVLCFPVFYFVTLAVMTATHAILPAHVGVPLNCAIATALLGFSAGAALWGLKARIMKAPPGAMAAREPEPAPLAAENATVLTPESGEPVADAEVTDITIEIDTPRPPGP